MLRLCISACGIFAARGKYQLSWFCYEYFKRGNKRKLCIDLLPQVVKYSNRSWSIKEVIEIPNACAKESPNRMPTKQSIDIDSVHGRWMIKWICYYPQPPKVSSFDFQWDNIENIQMYLPNANLMPFKRGYTNCLSPWKHSDIWPCSTESLQINQMHMSVLQKRWKNVTESQRGRRLK